MTGTLTLAIRHRIVPGSIKTQPQESFRIYHRSADLPWQIMQPSFWESGGMALTDLLAEGRPKPKVGKPQITKRLRRGTCGFILIDLVTKRVFSANDQFVPGKCTLSTDGSGFQSGLTNMLAMARSHMLEEITVSSTKGEVSFPIGKFIRETEAYLKHYENWVNAKIFNLPATNQKINALGAKTIEQIQKPYKGKTFFFTMSSQVSRVKEIPFKMCQENPTWMLAKANQWLNENGWLATLR